MILFQYVSLESAAPLVQAINDAKTEKQRHEASLIKQGYMRRCDEQGLTWPGCALDDEFSQIDPATGEERPMCCGEYLDWEPQ